MTSWRFSNYKKMLKMKILLRIDMNPFKSIWGLMLGILLLGVNRPIWAGLTSSVVNYVKAQEGR